MNFLDEMCSLYLNKGRNVLQLLRLDLEGVLIQSKVMKCSFFPQVQGVGSKGWRDVTTFFSGKPDDHSERYFFSLLFSVSL